MVTPLTLRYSDQTHGGFLNTRDANLVFLKSSHPVFPQSSVSTLVSELKTALQSKQLTGIQRAQYELQLQWLQEGTVPQAEYIAQSNGLISPADDTKYMCIMQGLLVGFSSYLWWHEVTSVRCSIH